jgi:predicted enzyme related to lactoylglutathione lyase
MDLTVQNAVQVRDFYRAVVGWGFDEVNLGDYADFSMKPEGADAPVSGICHARGMNADIPPQWMIYITVDDLDASLARCAELGGVALTAVKDMGGRMCVIRDPAGAVAALYEPQKK